MNTAGLILDFYDDSFASVIREDEGCMEKIASVNVMTSDQISEVADSDFALIMRDGADKHRKFAVHNGDHVMLSTHYFLANKDKLFPDAQKTAAFFLKRAHGRFNMDAPEELGKIAGDLSPSSNEVALESRAKLAYEVKDRPDLSGFPDDAFAMIKKEGAITIRRYPIKKKAYLQASVLYFNEHADEHTDADRMKVAMALMGKAEELGVSDEIDGLQKVASLGPAGFSPDLIAHIQTRKSMVDAESRSTLDELYSKREEFGTVKFAALLSKFDEMAELSSHYTAGLSDPYESLLPMEKIAGQVEFMDGTQKIGHDLIKSIGREAIDKTFGPETGEKWASDPIKTFEELSDASKSLVMDAYVKGL